MTTSKSNEGGPHGTTPILTREEVVELLAEGRRCREELEKRIERMHRFVCTCHTGMCAIHDKAR
jgi:hypothetical protein